MKTILFTGGHHTSALVVAQELKKRGHRIVWLGHKFTMAGDKSVSAEFQEVTKSGISFHELKTGKFYRIKNPFKYVKIIFGFIQSIIYLIRIKPDLIFSSGGYLAVPVTISGWFLGIPSVTHEQTVTAGWANRAITPFVKKIFLTHKSSLKNYPKNKSIITGLPLRSGIINTGKKYQNPKIPIIYITCGKQGSHKINQALFPIIPKLVKKYKIIHQTGAVTINQDQDKARRVKNSLPQKLKSRYLHQPYFFEQDAAKYLKISKLVISRAGAHTTYELLLLNKRSLIIPISWVSHNEQFKNAQLLKQSGLAVVLEESKLDPETLYQSIQSALQIKISKPPTPLVIPNAIDLIINQLQPYLESSHVSSQKA